MTLITTVYLHIIHNNNIFQNTIIVQQNKNVKFKIADGLSRVQYSIPDFQCGIKKIENMAILWLNVSVGI